MSRPVTFSSPAAAPPPVVVATPASTAAYALKTDLLRYQPAGTYVTDSFFKDYLSPFAKRSDLQDYQKRGNYAMGTDLMSYVQKDEMSKYATVDALNSYQMKGDYALKSDIPKVDLGPYALKTELPKVDLGPYALKSEIPKVDFSPYALKTDVPKVDFSPYALKSEIPKVDLSPYATKTGLAPYALKTDIPQVDLTPYALKTGLSPYALKTDIPAKPDLGSYALKTDIPKVDFGPYALKTDIPRFDLGPYALKTEIPKVDFSPYALKTEIPKVDFSPYALKAEIPKIDTTGFQPKGNYATADALSQYALKSDVQTSKINTTDQDKAFLPVEYYTKGVGIYQEMKTRRSLTSQIGNTEFPSTGQYLCAVETVVPGGGDTSGKVIQYAKCGANANYVRESYSATAWNEWSRLQTSGVIKQWNMSPGGAVSNISFGSDGKLWAVGFDGKLYWMNQTSTGWQLGNATIPIKTIDFTYDGKMMGCGADFSVLVNTMNTATGAWSWVRMEKSCCVKDIKRGGGGGGYYYGVGTDNQVFRTKSAGDLNSGWDLIPKSGSVTSIAFKDGILYGVGMDNQIYRKYNSNVESDWYGTGQMGILSICVGPDNEIWAAMLDGSLSRPMVNSSDYPPFGAQAEKSSETVNMPNGSFWNMKGMNVACPTGSALSKMALTRPSGNTLKEVFNCVAANDFGAIRKADTGNQDGGGGNSIYLDRHNIACNKEEALKSWTFNQPTGSTATFNYECTAAPGLNKCTNLYTPWNDEGGGNVIFLDRHNVQCPANSVLNRVQIVRNGAGAFRYDYTCCTR